MKLFEAFFNDNDKPWEFYERYNLNGESFIKKIPLQKETFIEDKNGDFKFILNQDIKLKKVQKTKNISEKTYGTNNVGLEWIRQTYWHPENSNYNKNPRIWALDIETTAHAPVNATACNEKIVSIQIFDNFLNTNIILALENFDVEKHTSKNGLYQFNEREYNFKLKYVKLNNESELLKVYFDLVNKLKPLIILAHNGTGFDFSYLWKRTEKNGIQEGFSPFGKSSLKTNELSNGQVFYNINAPGIFYMDSVDIYKKFILKPRPSYSLDYLCEVELGERKVNHDCFKTFDGFRTGNGYIKPKDEPSKDSDLEYKLFHAKNELEIQEISKEYFIHYSIIDTYLLFNLISKLKLINIMTQLASMMGIQIDQTLGTIMPWGNYIRNSAYLENLILPDNDEEKEYSEFKGGFVKDPLIGKYDWVFSVDVTSMYPSQIMAFNMSAETYVEPSKLPNDLRQVILDLRLSEDEEYHLNEYYKNPQKYEKLTELLKKYNLCCTLIGSCFKKDFQGIMPKLVEKIFKERKSTKKEMLKYEQLAEENKHNENYKKYTDLALELDVKQLTLKIAINALFGACGNNHFILYNNGIAAGITGNSRFYINLMGKNIEKYLNDLAKTKDEKYLIYQDTDSVVYDTLININDKQYKIGDFFNESLGKIKQIGDNKFIKEVFGYSTDSVNKKFEKETKNIKYVMKHKVKKKFYKIKYKDKEVILTEDHSLIVLRDNKLIAIKPKKIIKGDKIIVNEKVKNNNMIVTENFEIELLGKMELDVYDIEVEDNHNFFGNDILVHNSCYFNVPQAISQKLPQDKQKATDLISDFIESKIQPIINDSSQELGNIFNALDASKISAKREGISDKAIFIAKKRYFMRIIDSEFVRFAEPKIKTMGIDLVRSSTPLFSQKYLKESIYKILDSTEDELKKWINEIRKIYLEQNLMDIAKTSSVSSAKYNLETDKSIPINSRAFLISNNYIINNTSNDEFQPLDLGEKVKMLYLKTPNPLKSNIFAFNNEKFANLFKNFIDYDTNFEKFFLKPLEIMVEPLNYKIYDNNEKLEVW